MTVELITYHGWGFRPDIWKGWERRLPDELSVRHADRGYYDQPVIPEFHANADRKVILAHSFGLHWCPAEQLEEADHLILLCGFLRFHPREGQQERRSRLLLRQMMSRFVREPGGVIEDFYRNVYAPEPCPLEPPDSAELNHERLLEDLAMLDADGLPFERVSAAGSCTIIHGSEDRIVSREKSRELYSMLPDRARYFEVRHAGHAVGFTHTEECVQFAQPRLKNDPLTREERTFE